MNMLDKIDFLMERDNIKSKMQLAQMANIPYSTLSSLYSKDYKKAKLPTIQAICRVFGVSLDYLVQDNITTPNFGLQPVRNELASDEEKLIKDYRTLNQDGQAVVRDHMEMVAATPKYKKCNNISIEKHA